MKSILVTPHIESFAAEYSKNLFSGKGNGYVGPAAHLTNLRAALPGVLPALHPDYDKYILNIQKLYPFLNALKPSRQARLHQTAFAGLNVNLSLKIDINGKNREFYKHITAAMRYDTVRDEDYLPYAKKLGIRSCVYCNANYAHSLEVGNGIVGKFELDHFKPQSLFPYLCTNFYNLYPVCANCNKAKSASDPSFTLYTENPAHVNPFKFKLDKRSVIKYMLSQDYEDLQITFDPGIHGNHDTIFKISAISSTVKDVVEELVWKHKIYSPLYLKGLDKAFQKKFSHSCYNRMLLGNYDKAADIHMRPLSKMAQDIARQLGIII